MAEIYLSPVHELAQAIRRRQFSAAEVVEAHLRRIEQVNARLRALVQLAPDVRERAHQADVDLARGVSYGPLHGVPFTVKDVFDTAGIVTATGLEDRRRNVPSRDAVVVTRMREAGAILLGKTNCPPRGSGSDTENVLYGRTLNPYALDRTPGGSSGGEAALIAAGGSPVGLGSDADGGIRVPAHYCGVAGLKPTSGRIPNTGAYNQPGGLTDPRTQVGLLARSVRDLGLVLPMIMGPDYADSGVVPMPLGDADEVDIADLVIAYMAEDPEAPVTPETADTVGAAAQVLARAGAVIEPSWPVDLVSHARQITEAWGDMAGTRGQDVVELFGAIDYYRTHLLQFMARYDVLVCPAAPHPAPPFRERDPRRFDYTMPFNLTGYPCVVVRGGTAPGGLPIGVQVVARPWREDVALAVAQVIEGSLGGWRAEWLIG